MHWRNSPSKSFFNRSGECTLTRCSRLSCELEERRKKSFVKWNHLRSRAIYSMSQIGRLRKTGCWGMLKKLLLLLLLSRFSRVWLCSTPQTAAHQAPPSLGFSRQEHWSGVPFPSPMHESEKWKWSHSVVSDSANPWTAAHQAPPSKGVSRQEDWSGVPLPSPVKKLGPQ